MHSDEPRAPVGSSGVRPLHHTRTISAATAGLVLVLLALTVFSVATAVTNARAAHRAQQSAVLAGWGEQALDRLVVEEDLVDVLKLGGPEPDPSAPGRYQRARQEVGAALVGLRDAVPADRRGLVDRWIGMHDAYGHAVQVMLAVAPRDPAGVEAYEERYVDPRYDPLRSALKEEVARLYLGANDDLQAVGRIQQVMLVATPLTFGAGLALVAVFGVVLVRGRRLVLAQAEQNRYQALHDELTGLPNRTLLRRETEHALAGARLTGRPVALLLIDLDRFKDINDTLGHRYGDLVLQVLAARLRATLGGSAVVGRLGGDEFAVVLPQVPDLQSALAVADRIRGVMDAGIAVESVVLDVDASIGLVVSGEHGDDVDTLVQHADIAMYRAKERGGGVCVYAPELRRPHSRARLGLLGELRRAIDGGELLLEFQPKVTLPGGTFAGAEALVRWQHPLRGLLAPGMFVPAAERTALIHPLTRYVLDAALAECRRWHDDGRVLHVAVNVSVRNLLDDAFLPDVMAMLDRWGVPAGRLELEVTESAIMADPARARAVLRDFADRGVRLSIDDFGAGYTSLAHLSSLAVHTLKIDRSLVSRMTVEAGDAMIVRSVIELAHGLGLRTVAEGVEDPATRDLLAVQGCDVAQGFLFGRPMPPARLVTWADDAAARGPALPEPRPGADEAGRPDRPAMGRLLDLHSS